MDLYKWTYFKENKHKIIFDSKKHYLMKSLARLFRMA